MRYLKKFTINKLKIAFLTFCYSFLDQDTRYPKYLLNFEKKIAKFLGKKFALSFSNGTTACKVALYALGVKKGSKILLSKISFPSVISAILLTGCKPIFMEFDKNLQFVIPTPDKVKDCDYLLITHAYGYPNLKSNIDKLKKLNPKIKIIEDISHSQGSSSENILTGSLGDIAFMSMQGSKAISAGEGGLVITDSEIIKNKMLYLSHLNRKNEKDKRIETLSKIGFIGKGRMNPLGAIKASYKLDELNKRNERLRKKIKIIYDLLRDDKNIKLPIVRSSEKLGGFYYGVPFFLEDEVIRKKLEKQFRIIKYDWPPLDLNLNFNSPEKFERLLYLDNLEINDILNDIEDDRKFLFFFSLEDLILLSESKIERKIKKFINDF